MGMVIIKCSSLVGINGIILMARSLIAIAIAIAIAFECCHTVTVLLPDHQYLNLSRVPYFLHAPTHANYIKG